MSEPTATSRLLSQHAQFTPLQQQAQALRESSIENMLKADAARVSKFSVEAAGLHLDFSKHLLDEKALSLLLDLATSIELDERIQDLFRGGHVNNTEDRPALHILLRAASANGHEEKYAEVAATAEQMKTLATKIHEGQSNGYTGKPITDVVNIGIGGSDLGPRLAADALRPYHGKIRCHYVANVDPADMHFTLGPLNPETTLFIICSKSFRTEETLANGLLAREWLLAGGANDSDLNRHFLAVTTNLQAAADFGIPTNNCLPMWDWVGGRYSVWSAVGLSTAIAVGWDVFSRLLAGARIMDEHFRDAPLAENLPVIMSLLEIWCCNFLGAGNHVVLPYDQTLDQLPNYLQQLTMESNGKSVNVEGEELPYNTAPVLWGSAGTIGQHSFHQLLHQGTLLCPVDFVMPLSSHTAGAEQHRRLVANCMAQSRTLMVGRTAEQAENSLRDRGVAKERTAELTNHLVMPGNRPNSMITMEKLTPETLGALLAAYEHRTFCSAQFWGINPFDQWGVEAGKEIGADIFARLSGDGSTTMDASTEALIAQWRKVNANN